MTKRERVRFYMFIRVVRFISDNIADFAAGSVVLAQLAILQGVITTIETLSGEQIGGLSGARFGFNSKDTARENLRELLEHIAETARSMVYEIPGIDLQFRMIRGDSDANLLALARSFLANAVPLKDTFTDTYEMDKDFLTDLQNFIDEFENALSVPGTAVDEHVEATAEIGTEIRKGMVIVRTMNGAVLNKYRGDAGKTAAWVSASHIEKLSEGREPTPPAP
jgi:hypothetical protein